MTLSPIWIRLCALSLFLATPAFAQAPDGAIYEGDLVLVTGQANCPATGALRYRARIVGATVHFDLIPLAPPGPEQRDVATLAIKSDGTFGRVRQEQGLDITSSGRFTDQTGAWEVISERADVVVCHHRVEARRVSAPAPAAPAPAAK